MQLKKLLIRPLKILGLLAAVAYPIAVFVALQCGFSVRLMGIVLICIVLIGMAKSKILWVGICGILLAVLSLISNQDIFLKLYPVFMNAGVGAVFAVSLRGTPLIQQFIQKMRYEMTPKVIKHARMATIAWVIFLAINTLISLATVFMSDLVWTVYNGLISYCLIGLMILVEYIIHVRARRNEKNN